MKLKEKSKESDKGGLTVYRKLEPALRMTNIDASERFPDEYFIIRLDNQKALNQMGTVLYVGNDGEELFGLALRFDDPTNCRVSEGTNLQRAWGYLR